jgi:PAS domain S-box-containing protein
MSSRRQRVRRSLPQPAAEVSAELAAIVEHGPAMLFRWRVARGWPVEFASRNVRQLGYTAEDFMSGRVSWVALTHPEDVPRLEKEVRRYLQQGVTRFDQQYRLRTKAGTYRWFEDHNRVLRDARGRPKYIQGVILDVTDRRRVEDALRQSTANLHALAENAWDAILISDARGRHVYANRAASVLTGYSKPELLRMKMTEIITLWHRRRMVQITRQRLAGRPTYHTYESRILRKDGAEAVVEISAARTVWEGQPCTMGIVRDITRRHEAEVALLRSETALRYAESLAHIGSWWTDLRTRQTTLSNELFHIYGLDPRQFDGRAETVIGSAVHPDDRRMLVEAMHAALRHLVCYPLEFRVVRKDGTIRTVQARYQMLRDGAGEPLAIVGAVQDITDRRTMAQEILRTANQEKHSIGQAIHDSLGQQLTGIAFVAKALEQRLASGGHPAAALARQLGSQARTAAHQSRELAYGLMPVDLASEGLAAALARLARGTNQLYGIDCIWAAGKTAHVYDHAVATQLFFVAQEAITNAVRHADAKRVVIRLTTGKNEGALTIANDGRLWATEQQRTRGLGLAIMRSRAEIVGGVLRIEVRGRKTVLVCTFRNRRPPTASRTSAPSGRDNRGSRQGSRRAGSGGRKTGYSPRAPQAARATPGRP